MQTEWWPELLTISKHISLNAIVYTQLNSLPIGQQWKTQKDWLNRMRNSYNRQNGNFLGFFMFRFRLRCPLKNINVLQQNWKFDDFCERTRVISEFFLYLKVVIQDQTNDDLLRGCLHDTGATFAPGRVHSGSLSWLNICLHDNTTKCYAGASHPGVSSPRFSHRGENFTPVRNLATVSCKRETTSHFSVKSVCR